jgi:DNA gyrase inhibitor GyrI
MTTNDDNLDFADVEVPAIAAVQLAAHAGTDPGALGAVIGSGFETLAAFIGRHNLQCTAPPRVVYDGYGPDGISVKLLMPISQPEAPPNAEPPVAIAAVPASHAYRFTHQGSYKALAQTYGKITAFMKGRGLMQCDSDWSKYMPMWEEYLNSPTTTPEDDLLTHIFLPVKD